MNKPINHEITVLVKDLLMPLAEKTKANVGEFEKLLEEEMLDDLHYMTDIDQYSKMACIYQEKVKECKCLEIELSKQHETVSKEDYHKLCMRTHSQSCNSNCQQQQVHPTFVEPFNLVEPIDNQAHPVVTMADNHTMAQLLEAPTEGYEDAIVVPEITADNFELKHGLLTLVQNKQFLGHGKEDPHAHIRYFNKIISTMKFLNVPSTSVKLMLFSFSLEGATWILLGKEPLDRFLHGMILFRNS
ncbi:hypothetical protein Tco_0153183 [Tanacetum coccineum]